MPAAVRRCSKAGTRHVRNLIGEMLRMLSNRLSSIHFAVVFFLKKNLMKFYLWIEKFSNNRGCMKVGWIWEMQWAFHVSYGRKRRQPSTGQRKAFEVVRGPSLILFWNSICVLGIQLFPVNLISFPIPLNVSLLLCPALENSENLVVCLTLVSQWRDNKLNSLSTEYFENTYGVEVICFLNIQICLDKGRENLLTVVYLMFLYHFVLRLTPQ